MRCVRSTLLVCCALLSACSVDRLPLVAEELLSDGGESDATFHWEDANQTDPDAASDAASEIDARLDDASLDDAHVSDAGATQDASSDAGTDAQDPVDAYVPPPRYAGTCMTDHDCEMDEVCVRSEGLLGAHSYCAQRCTEATDCSAGPAGSATPRCSSGRCRLPCDAVIGSGCPRSMTCQDLLLILPADDGTCTFQE